jgi:hypothetical protein
MYSDITDKLLLYPCTIVGYIRLLLLGAAMITVSVGLADGPEARLSVAILSGLSLLLDMFDGYLARRFGHTTQFGLLFDLAIDLISHTFIWTISGFYFAAGLIILEWTAGLYIAAFSMKPNTHWKRTVIDRGPPLIKIYFARNQRNLLSAYGNIGHFIFPMTLYLDYTPNWVGYAALPGLVLYEVVTLYLFYILIRILASHN